MQFCKVHFFGKGKAILKRLVAFARETYHNIRTDVYKRQVWQYAGAHPVLNKFPPPLSAALFQSATTMPAGQRVLCRALTEQPPLNLTLLLGMLGNPYLPAQGRPPKVPDRPFASPGGKPLAASVVLAPVSYTHLDVYKRQLLR